MYICPDKHKYIAQEKNIYIVGSTDSEGALGCGFVPDRFPLCNLAGTGFFQTNAAPAHDEGIIISFTTDGVLEWSTFFGGLYDEDCISDIVILNDRKIITGYTVNSIYSGQHCVAPVDALFPFCDPGGGAYTQGSGGNADAFIASFDANNNLEWSTFIGGGGVEAQHSILGGPKITVNNNSEVFVFGTTKTYPSNSFFPLMNNFFYYYQNQHADDYSTEISTDNFILGFNQNFQQIYGSYFGGKGFETGLLPRRGEMTGGITTFEDKIYICGGSYSTQNFPLFCPTVNNPYCQGYSAVSSSKSGSFIAQLYTGVANNIENNNSIYKQEISIYPNPSDDGHYSLEINDAFDLNSIKVYDIFGKTVKEISINSLNKENIIALDLSNHPAGVYLVHFISSSEYVVSKIIRL
jgi:hypothetical protein